jgi:polysaccharide export outer membrane protein
MRIMRFRVVVSALLVLAMMIPSGVMTVPLARAQQGPGFGQSTGPVGGYGYQGGGFGQPGFGAGFGSDAPSWQGPYPIPQQQQGTQAAPPMDRGRSTMPGICTSQTYHTLTVERPGPEVKTVALGRTGSTNQDADRGEPKKAGDGRRTDFFEVLSPIEAAFQMKTPSGERLIDTVFEPARPIVPPRPEPHMPGTNVASPSPNDDKSAESPRRLEERIRALEDQSEVKARGDMKEGTVRTPLVPASPASATRFLGPYGAPLRQYGYAVFSSYISTFAPVDDVPVGPDYVVGPGDSLTISMWGPLESTVLRTVDRNGQILLPKVGDVRVWGLTFAQTDRFIREQLGRYFRGFQTSVTMGRLRTMRVQVIGEVCQPGSYTVNSLATLTQALYSAGGPTKLGSLRNVRLLRNSHVVGEIDLYDFLLRGDRTRDYRLESGDTIFVPTIGDVAAVTGEVKRPAIYEIRNDVRLADIVEAAGGATPTSYLKRVQIVRAQQNAERVTVDVDLSDYYLKGDMESNPPIHGGDLVLIHKNDSRIYNTVKVDGAVKYPGVYELKPMMRLSQLLPADRLMPEAYVDRVEIARRRPDYSVEVISVNLKKAWAGDLDQDPLLKANDDVSVRTEMRATRTMTLSGQVARPGTYIIGEGERLSSLLDRAGGFTSRAYLKGSVFTRASLRKVEQEQLDAFVRVQEQRILAEASRSVAGGDKESGVIDASLVQARRDFLRALASRVAVGRMVIKLAPSEKLKATTEDIVLADGDSLDVPEPVDSVLVLGSVRNSTSVFYSPGTNVDEYVNRVGGYSKEADKKEIHIVRADGSAVAGFSNIRTVEAGDTIIVPRSEESKIRWLPTIRDGFSIFGSTLGTVASLATLAVLFH